MLRERIAHSKQGSNLTSIQDTDKLVIAQTDTTGAAGYRTVTTTAKVISDKVIDEIGNAGATITVGDGLTGTGTPSNPVRVDDVYVTNHYVPHQYNPITQAGGILDGQWHTSVDATTGVVSYPSKPIYAQGLSISTPAITFNVFNELSKVGGDSLYVYLELRISTLHYRFSDTPLATTYYRFFIGRYITKVTNNVRTITNHRSNEFITFNNFQVPSSPPTASGIRGKSLLTYGTTAYELPPAPHTRPVLFYVNLGITRAEAIPNQTAGIIQYTYRGKYSDVIKLGNLTFDLLAILGKPNSTVVNLEEGYALFKISGGTPPDVIYGTFSDRGARKVYNDTKLKFTRAEYTHGLYRYFVENSTTLNTLLQKSVNVNTTYVLFSLS